MLKKKIKEILDKYSLKYDKKRIKNIENIIGYFKNMSYDELENIILENYTIGESYFFRDKELWDSLKKYLSLNKKDKYNILSLGCSRGEEVYTLSFVLNDIKNIEYKITGVDASFERIKQAKEGKYKYWSIRKLSQIEINKYFEKKDDYYFVKEKYKKNINFEVSDIGKYIKRDIKYDIIFLRRVLIYFTEIQINSILKNIKNILNNEGLLILGHGEFYPYITELFEFETINNVVLWKKTSSINKNISHKLQNFKTFRKSVLKENTNLKKPIESNKKKKLIESMANISEEEYLEIIENLISEKNYIFAYNLIKKIADKSLNYLIWKYKAFLEIQLNLDYKDSLNKAIFLNPDDEELWNMKNYGR
ncbi:CheR family methyltransferase [Marinitoga aeolica]|uniref:Methyltransferase domain-containing protein n=1 Tax=Marinitoga aeolica TaxID=2809031 RepID=A0ABY8PP29_9BACT|nr:CheR family methyltransferase [Marinitoga aeolica]WGS64399.1 methyltransferase domain-containing protein [Marinitoga aeolica]